MTSDALKYLASVPSRDRKWEDCFLDVHCLRRYVDDLQHKSSLTAGTVAEKICRLRVKIFYAKKQTYILIINYNGYFNFTVAPVLDQITAITCKACGLYFANAS